MVRPQLWRDILSASKLWLTLITSRIGLYMLIFTPTEPLVE